MIVAPKYTSRKLLVTGIETLILILVPLIYKKCDVDKEVTLMTLGLIGVAAGLYKGANILGKKFGGDNEQA